MSDPLMATYRRLPVTFTHGEGAWLWDQDGKRYLDALSGIAVCGLGHAHPAVREALCDQAGTLVHTSNLYQIAAQTELGAQLTALAGMDRVFFGNSGAEANEAAIKLARLHGHHRGVEKPAILVMENSFHGRTLATLTATGNRKVQAGFEPLVQGFVRVPYDDLAAVETAGANRHDLVAILVEPIQGEGGIRVPAPDYLPRLREICDRHGWLLMLDEIQTGMGRTGKLFAHQHSGIQPDVMTLAKGLANGVPIGACLARGAAAEVFGPGSHGSTFGGNPLACRAASAVLATIEGEGLTARADERGEQLLAGFRQALAHQPGVRDIRGLGLMIGTEFRTADHQPDKNTAKAVVQACQERGMLLLTCSTWDNTIRWIPPLVVTAEEIDKGLSIFAEALAEVIK